MSFEIYAHNKIVVWAPFQLLDVLLKHELVHDLELTRLINLQQERACENALLTYIELFVV